MSLDSDVRFLLSCDFFQLFSASHLRLLSFGCDKISLEKGQVLYSSGEKAVVAYVLFEGSIDLFCPIEKKTVHIAEVKPGAVLGELALITLATRFETAIASEKSSLMIIQKRYFRRILQEHPEVIPKIQQKIQENMHNIAMRMEAVLSAFHS